MTNDDFISKANAIAWKYETDEYYADSLEADILGLVAAALEEAAKVADVVEDKSIDEGHRHDAEIANAISRSIRKLIPASDGTKE